MPAARPFPPELRLKTAGEFDHVFKKARRSGSKYFTVLARANGLDHPRLGLIVSKKCSRTAVGRNRLKRIIRESFRHHADRIGPLDVVVLGKPPARGASNEALFEALRRHWKELGRKRQRCDRS